MGLTFFNPEEHITKTSGKLPHWTQAITPAFITWRLGDSLPQKLLSKWKREKDEWIQNHPEPWDTETEAEYHEVFTDRIHHWLDQGYGSCLFKKPKHREVLGEALHHFQEERYRLYAYVIMPNHVHLLASIFELHDLGTVVGSWKKYSARQINAREDRSGPLWQEKYWDRLIRSERHFRRVLRYIMENPTEAGLRPGTFTLWVNKQALTSMGRTDLM